MKSKDGKMKKQCCVLNRLTWKWINPHGRLFYLEMQFVLSFTNYIWTLEDMMFPLSVLPVDMDKYCHKH